MIKSKYKYIFAIISSLNDQCVPAFLQNDEVKYLIPKERIERNDYHRLHQQRYKMSEVEDRMTTIILAEAKKKKERKHRISFSGEKYK